MLLSLQNIYFGYQPENYLFKNINFSLDQGKIVALAGESGCGKSTFLNLIYGLLHWQQGEIFFNNKKLFGPRKNIVPGEEEMKLVSQHYDLMPFSTVAENVGKFLSNTDLQEKNNRIQEVLEVVGMTEFANVLPKFLSGGQQQRVAIARSLAVLPKLLLLDEPFSNLDFSRKIELREKLFNFTKEHQISVIISTHELLEVLPWTDQIVVFQEGRLIQNDSPEETYRFPYNAYVAQLLGETNVISLENQEKLQLKSNYFYPHQIKISESGREAQVIESRFAGHHFWNRISVDGVALVMYSPDKLEGTIKIDVE